MVVLAAAGGAAALAASRVPVTVRESYRPLVSISRGEMEGELLAARAALEPEGHVLVDTLRFDRRAVITQAVPLGQCVTVVAASSGRRRVRHIEWLHRDARAWEVPDGELRAQPYRRSMVSRVCPMRATLRRGAPSAELHFRVQLVGGDGEGAAVVLVGPPGPVPPPGAEVLGDRVLERSADIAPAAANTAGATLAILLIGLMIESALRSRRDVRDRERTLRRFTIALPAGLRGVLESIAPAGPRDARLARALRDQRASLAPLARAAVFQRWRDDQEWIDARHAALCAQLADRRAEGKDASYRASDDGLFTITLLVRHRCELPELPARLDELELAFALESSLPRDDEELVGAEVRFHPRERTAVLGEAQVFASFPELVPLGAGGSSCGAREAPVQGSPARCPACGEPLGIADGRRVAQ